MRCGPVERAKTRPEPARIENGIALQSFPFSLGLALVNWHSVALLLLLLCVLATSASAQAPPEADSSAASPLGVNFDPRLDPDRAAIDRKFAEELDALARKCDELQLPEQAQITRRWFIPRRYQVQYHFPPDAYARETREKRLPTPPSASAPELQQRWWKRFNEVRASQAERLFEFAKHRLSEKRLQESFALLHEVLWENPDHAEARRILGYRGKPGNWTPQERQPRYSRTSQYDPTFNWAPNRHGVVDTAHFRIRTNADPKAAIETATFLEDCRDVWSIVFTGFWLDAAELQARFDGKDPPPPPRSTKKLEVVLFASREEYIAQLEPYEKNIAASSGYFAPGRMTSFFYVDAEDESVRINWAHEISHQLFSAASRNPPTLGRNAHFWVIEGAAMYMESLTRRGGYFTTGGFESQRLQDARHRLHNQRQHAALSELTPLGQEAFQRDPRVREYYTAAAGYTHFLLDGDHGRRRDAFHRFLKGIYDEQDSVDRLETQLGAPVGEIEEAYRNFLDVTDDDLRRLNDASIRRLVLGRTSATPNGLLALKQLAGLKKLDLTDLKGVDDSLSFLAPKCDLEELSLFGTAVTSNCSKRLAQMKSLRELNLSHTKIDDRAIATLSSLPSLAVLEIANTKVTDAAEQSLRKLRSLQELDLEGTSISAECRERLKAANPNLQLSP